MKNNKKGFIVPLLLGIIALLVISGGAYVYLNHNNNPAPSSAINESGNESVTPLRNFNENASSTATSSVSASNSKFSLTDQMIVDVFNKNTVSAEYNGQLKLTKDSYGGYSKKSEAGYFGINNFVRGDLNGDGYEDAIVTTTYCGASCGTELDIVINDKNGAGHQSENGIPGWRTSSAAKSSFRSGSIKNGVISITADRWLGSGENNVTKTFHLEGEVVIDNSWKTYSDNEFGLSFRYPPEFGTPTKSIFSTRSEVKIENGANKTLTISKGIYYNQSLGRNMNLVEVATPLPYQHQTAGIINGRKTITNYGASTGISSETVYIQGNGEDIIEVNSSYNILGDDSRDEMQVEEFYQIVQTIKFTN